MRWGAQINLPGSPYRKAKEARTKLLAAIRPSVEKAISDLKAGKFDHLRRKSTMQNFMATSAAEGDELDAKDVSVCPCCLVQGCFDQQHVSASPDCWPGLGSVLPQEMT